jgi:pyruvate/2-oxoglutarate dehydrogenase complex dihydrolipoamide dehydrogenase (E3) component
LEVHVRTEFDLVVIGAGMAGLNAMDRAVAAGRHVAVIERDRVGGTCPIRGCIPSKALIRSAEVAHEARRAAEFGIRVGEVEVDFPAVIQRVRAIIDAGATATRTWVESLETVELIDGEAAFVSPTEVRVGERIVRAPRIVIATGAAPTRPPIPGLDRTPYLTSDDVLQLASLPKRLIVIGAGPIALELGQALGRLGAQVTMLEVHPRLLPDEDGEIVDALRDYLVGEGLVIHTGIGIERTQARGSDGVRVVVTEHGTARHVDADALIVAAGRTPVIGPLDLRAAGIDDGGQSIDVDSHLQTSQPGIYAAGDVLGGAWGQFTHVARRLGVEAAELALGLGRYDVRPDIGPHALFTDPELASIGLSEHAAREAGHEVRVGRRRFSGGKARAWGEERGLAKVVVDARTGRMLGAHILAYHAADLLHPIVVAMASGDAVGAVRRSPHIHPTLGEFVKSAVEGAA